MGNKPDSKERYINVKMLCKLAVIFMILAGIWELLMMYFGYEGTWMFTTSAGSHSYTNENYLFLMFLFIDIATVEILKTNGKFKKTYMAKFFCLLLFLLINNFFLISSGLDIINFFRVTF